MSESSNNGHTQWGDSEGVGKTAYERLAKVGGRGERHGNAYTNGEGADSRKAAESKEPPHNVKRHPEDPAGAYRGVAEEVCDPEQIRRNAERFGKASQAIDPEWFEWLVRPLYRCVHDVRIGAIVGPSRRAAGEQFKRAATTEAAIAEIHEEGGADGEQADRLKSEVIPRVERELMDEEGKVKEAEEETSAAREEVSRVRTEEEEKRARLADEPRRSPWKEWVHESGTNLFSRLRLSPGKAGIVFLAEVAGSAYLLAPDVADIINTSFNAGLVISAVISLAMLAAAFAAGSGLAAIRLPGWAVGVSVVSAFAAILVKFVPALDALRKAEEAGIETLTAATLAAFLIAMVSGYVLAIADDRRQVKEAEDEEAELLKRAGTPLANALQVLAKKEEKQRKAEQKCERLDKLLSALWEQVETLRDRASRAGAAAERRRQEGIEAEVEAETIRTIAEAGIEQEEAAAEWAYLIALAAQEKARAEEPPKVPESPAPATRSGVLEIEARNRDDLSLLQMLALGVAAASGIASLFLGPIPLGVGIPLAALLILLDRRSGGPRGTAAGDSSPPDRRPRIVADANAENPFYIYQPDRMVPKYGDGGADAGQRQ